MHALVGVDAGGSRTTALVADASLHELARVTGPPGGIRPDRIEQAARAIVDTVRSALAAARLDQALVLVVGAAGAGSETERVALESALRAAGVAAEVRVTTDIAIALTAAFGEGPGIMLLAGTGSGGCARLLSGEIRRVGGHGWRLGDEGSGYALGRAALGAVARAADGRGPATSLTQELLTAGGAPDVAALMYWGRTAPPAAIADLAARVQRVAAQGDSVAQALVEQTADDLVAHARALVGAFPASKVIPFALAGGLVRAESPVRTALLRRVHDQLPALRLTLEAVDPPRGAIRLAAAPPTGA